MPKAARRWRTLAATCLGISAWPAAGMLAHMFLQNRNEFLFCKNMHGRQPLGRDERVRNANLARRP